MGIFRKHDTGTPALGLTPILIIIYEKSISKEHLVKLGKINKVIK